MVPQEHVRHMGIAPGHLLCDGKVMQSRIMVPIGVLGSYRGYMGIKENNMQTTISGLQFRAKK